MSFTTTGKILGPILVKKFRIDGVKINMKCPKCLKVTTEDRHMMRRPEMNAPEPYFCYCEHCAHSWEVTGILKVSFEPYFAPRRKPKTKK